MAPPGKIAWKEVDVAIPRKLVAEIYETVQIGRNLRAEAKVPSNKKAQFILRSTDSTIAKELPTVSRLLNAAEIKLDRDHKAQPGVPVANTPLGDLFLVIDVANAKAENQRLDNEIERLEIELCTVRAKLDNASFVERAPAAVVAEHRQREKDFSAQLEKLKKARGGQH